MTSLDTTASDIETVVSVFLRDLSASDCGTSAASTYRVLQLLALAQGFFVLNVVQNGRGTSTTPTEAAVSVCTERDLYYRNPPLFGHQRSAHASIERVCRWLDAGRSWAALNSLDIAVDDAIVRRLLRTPQHVHGQLQRLLAAAHGAGAGAAPNPRAAYTRESLGITAAGKATLAGALVMELCSPPESVDVACCGTSGVSLTHSLVGRLVACHRPAAAAAAASALVVVEKESIFHALLRSAAHHRGRLRRSYIFLCTKGYPCVAAQQWLRRVHALWPSLELHLLVDGDPHGLCIGLTAMGLLGSAGTRRGTDSPVCPLPFRLLGACPSRVFCHDGAAASPSHPALSPSAGVPLSCDDHRVLQRVIPAMRKALNGLGTPASASAVAIPTRRTTAVATLRGTLEKMLKEAEWMARASVKCELQLACTTVENPLCFVEAHLS